MTPEHATHWRKLWTDCLDRLMNRAMSFGKEGRWSEAEALASKLWLTVEHIKDAMRREVQLRGDIPPEELEEMGLPPHWFN